MGIREFNLKFEFGVKISPTVVSLQRYVSTKAVGGRFASYTTLIETL